MSGEPSDAHGHHGHEEHYVRPEWHYWVVIGLLAVITLYEIGPLFEWYNIPTPALIVLSAGKFLLVVLFFMHLIDDHSFFSQVFFAPLAGAILMVFVLMLLFSSVRPSPHDDPVPMQERHWSTFSSECSSWLRSHVSNKMYCASPVIPLDRIRMDVAPETMRRRGAAAAEEEVDLSGLSDDEKLAKLAEMGEGLYGGKGGCVACHQANGQGVPGAFPPLAGSDYPDFLDPIGHAKIILHGMQGPIVVNGVQYNGVMQGYAGVLSDVEIAAIATYERTAWGNDHGMVTPEQVASAR